MSEAHLSEKEIQAFAIDQAHSPVHWTTHVNQCITCRHSVATYKLIFHEIKQQPAVAFDFDLAKLVVAQLPKPKAIGSSVLLMVLSWLTFLALSFCAVCYVLRGQFFNFIVTEPLINLLIVISASLLFLGLLLDVWMKFQEKIKVIDHIKLQH